jgi:hypothetical protein
MKTSQRKIRGKEFYLRVTTTQMNSVSFLDQIWKQTPYNIQSLKG